MSSTVTAQSVTTWVNWDDVHESSSCVFGFLFGSEGREMSKFCCCRRFCVPAFHQTSCQRWPVSVTDDPCHSSGWIHRPTQEFGRLIRRHQESVSCMRFHNRFSPLARQKWMATAGSLPCSWVVWVSVAVRRSGTLPIGVVGQIVWRWSNRDIIGVLGRPSTEWPSVWDT